MMNVFLLLCGIAILIVAIAYSYTLIKGIGIMKKELDDLKKEQIFEQIEKRTEKIKKQL